MRSFIGTFRVLAIAAALLLAGCSAAGATPTPTPSPTPAPAVSPSPVVTPSPTAAATPTPVPTTDGQGDEYVTGTLSLTLTTAPSETKVGDVTQLRGGVVTIDTSMNDPRVSGTGTFAFSADTYTKVGSEWGTFRLENAGGTWEGQCSGGAWDLGNATMWSCWLLGSGAYHGYTSYLQFVGSEDGTVPPSLEGIIYPGSPPKP